MNKFFIICTLSIALFGCQSTAQKSSVERVVSSQTDERVVRSTQNHPSVIKFVGNQMNGTSVQVDVVKCGEGTCLLYKVGNSATKNIVLINKDVHVSEMGLMGFHFGNQYEAFYVYYYFNRSDKDVRSGVTVIDPNQAKAVAFVDNASMLDYQYYNTYFSVVKSPERKGYPFLAPGMHYLDKPYWPFLCMFDPKNISKPDTNCGTGFRSVSVSFKDQGKDEVKVSGFRHSRGWLLDVDKDGWDDIHLPYFKYILSLSGRTGKQINLGFHDVAQFTEPKTHKWFHQGRWYGGYTTFVDPRNKEYMTAVVAGSTVGTFENWNCNVSRYVAALRWKRATSKLDWAQYLAFSTTQFTWDYSSVNSYFRRGDYIDNCIHRFSDSLINVNGQPYLAYSMFNTDIKNGCEQEALDSQRTHMQEPELTKFRTCMENVSKSSRGVWSVYTKNAITGQTTSDLTGYYLWGRVEQFFPGEGALFLLETFSKDGQRVRFDKVEHLPENFTFSRGPATSWAPVTGINDPGAVPKIESYECYTSQSGMDSSSPDSSCGRPELVTRDVDGDGMNDILLDTPPGAPMRWIGYSLKAKKVIVKKIQMGEL
ncbi:MAG: hypothetical protein AB7O96_17615 [Pseudobdellovibrionaceae bacterium]